MVFDSLFDQYRGVIPSIRVIDGSIKKGDEIKFMASKAKYEVIEVGVFKPEMTPVKELLPGDVGYFTAAIKSIDKVGVGDTVTHVLNQTAEALPGYRKMNPVVFSGLYPIESKDYNALKDALDKLKLNDASLDYEPESSQALGFGFRTGFFGLLHMEIIQERIRREFDIELLATAPSVIYKITTTDGKELKIDNPYMLPEMQKVEKIEEPYVKAVLMAPSDYVGAIMELCQSKRGIFQDMVYVDSNRVQITYELPLSEIVYDFFDKLKSTTKGYATFDYEISDYRESKLQKMDILINGEVVDALSVIVHRDFAYRRGRAVVEKLKDLIPRQQFEVPIQAALGGKIIARSTVRAVRKDVIAKCYGGDITRKKKLLERQKEGKKRMKSVGSVEVPQEAFLAILSNSED